MIKQTIKFALRSFRKSTLVHFLNVAGLTLGLSVYFLVTLYLYQEKSYERGFSENENIFQISHTMIGYKMAMGSENLIQVIHEIPEVQHATSFGVSSKKKIKVGDELSVARTILADSSFLKVFDFELKSGDPKTALQSFNSVLLTESFARTLFDDSDYYGKEIKLERFHSPDSTYEESGYVTGIIKDPIFKTQLNFDIVFVQPRIPDTSLPLDGWQSSSIYNYIRAVPNTTTEELDEKLFDLSHKYIQPKTYGGTIVSKEEWREQPLYCGFYAEALGDLRNGSETRGNLMPVIDQAQVKTMTVVAFAALIISILNFISLSTARASARMKEVGVKRILGSSKRQLVVQFMTESFIAVLLASTLALACVEGIIHLNTDLIGIKIDYSVLQTTEWVVGLLLFIIVLTIVSGIYPALYLSSTNLSSVLRNGSAKKSFSILNASSLRKGAAILQFTCSAGLIIAVITMFLQVDHLQERDLGYEPSNVFVVNTYDLGDSKNTFRDALSRYPSIESAAHIDKLPFDDNALDRPQSLKLTDSTEVSYKLFQVDTAFFKTVDMEFVQGYGFEQFDISGSNNSDSVSSRIYPVIINEVMAKMMGYGTSEPQKLNDTRFQVIGVVNDFVFNDLRQRIEPVMLVRKTSSSRSTYHYPLLVKANDLSKAREDIAELWSEFSEKNLNISLMESSYKDLLKIEEAGLQAVLVFSIFSVIVSCFGLFGLAVFTLDQRVHEFGIRKVLGASVSDIIKLFGSSFFKLILFAFVLAIPASVYLLNNWLNAYADRISLTFEIFLISAVLISIIVGLTLLVQSLKAGRLNPVETLRNE